MIRAGYVAGLPRRFPEDIWPRSFWVSASFSVHFPSKFFPALVEKSNLHVTCVRRSVRPLILQVTQACTVHHEFDTYLTSHDLLLLNEIYCCVYRVGRELNIIYYFCH